MPEDAPASASRAGRTPTESASEAAEYSEADVLEAYQDVVAHTGHYETAEQRQAFVTAAIAMEMRLTHGQLPGSLGVRTAAEPDRQ